MITGYKIYLGLPVHLHVMSDHHGTVPIWYRPPVPGTTGT